MIWTCLAHAEQVRIPAFTAFSEPAPAGIQVRENDGVYNWTDKTQSVVWYGDLHDAGALQSAVQLVLSAGQTVKWVLSITGQNPDAAKGQTFTLEATATGTAKC
jgi:hypothetical protein